MTEHLPSPGREYTNPKRSLLKEWIGGLFKKKVKEEISVGNPMKNELPKLNANLDDVECSVFAPPQTPAGSSILIQVFARLLTENDQVKKEAATFDSTSTIRGTKQLEEKIQQGSKLTFVLSMKGVVIDEAVQSLKWLGKSASVQFGVTIPTDRAEGNVIGTIYVTQDSLPFGHMKFVLRIADETSVAKEDKVRSDWKRYNYAFISYASNDRAEVLKRVQMLPRFHINFFQDLLSVEPGDRWEKRLYEEIDRSDVFFLFWSTSAKNSKWVMQEVNYALKRKTRNTNDTPEIIPIIIEGPPPAELKDIHFNDTFLYFINSSKSS